MKYFFIVFRIIIYVNFVLGVLLVISEDYIQMPEVNIALLFYCMFLILVNAMLNSLEKDYKMLKAQCDGEYLGKIQS